MHITVNFEGYIKDIIENAIEKGLAKTKTEALRLGILELNDKYNLLKNDEEILFLKNKLEAIDNQIKAGKLKEETEVEVAKKYPELF
jgi:Arc/MetJ-type ribon-helix-helix transcriptional regulator